MVLWLLVVVLLLRGLASVATPREAPPPAPAPKAASPAWPDDAAQAFAADFARAYLSYSPQRPVGVDHRAAGVRRARPGRLDRAAVRREGGAPGGRFGHGRARRSAGLDARRW